MFRFVILKKYSNIMLSKIILSVIVFLGSLSINLSQASSSTSVEQELDKIVAVVGEDIITKSELNSKLVTIYNGLKQQNISLPSKKVLTKQVLEKLILDLIQLQLAKQMGIEVDNIAINQIMLDLAKKEHLTIDQFKKRIQEEGISLEELREQLKNEKIIAKLHEREIIHDIKISNADIEGYLNSPVGQDNSGVEYRLGHILIEGSETFNPAELKEINQKVVKVIEKLKHGKDFKEIAASYSSGMEALNGGDLGWRKINQIPSIFVKYVLNMQVGDISEPIKSKSGFHIIKLQDKKFGNKEGHRDGKLNDDMRNQIIGILREQKFNEILEIWLKKIRKEAKVKIYL